MSTSGHAVHVSAVLVPAVLMAGWALAADVRAWAGRRGAAAPGNVLIAAALMSTGAAAVHAMVVRFHLVDDLLSGVFFAVTAAAQLGWAVTVVRRPGPRVLLSGLVLQGGLVGLWLWTRTIGIPFGAAAGQREPVGVLDATAVVLELVVVACCALALRPAPQDGSFGLYASGSTLSTPHEWNLSRPPSWSRLDRFRRTLSH